MKKIAILTLLLSAVPCFGQGPEVEILPPNPTAGDSIVVRSCYGAGPFVETKELSITDHTIAVRFVQDGANLFPNPGHCAEITVGPLPPGAYTFVVTRELPGQPSSVQQFEILVAAAMPLGHVALLALGVALLIVGMRRSGGN